MNVDMKTKKVLFDMICEDTGRALCDSGGDPKYDENGKYIGSSSGYGRNFERNARRTFADFEAEPESVVSFRRGKIEVTHSVFHWLALRLTYDQVRDDAFQEWAVQPEHADESWFELVEAYMGYLKRRAELPGCDGACGCGDDCTCTPEWSEELHVPAGIYGDGEPLTVNTYNNEDLLSQTIQYTFWTEGEGRNNRRAFVLLAVHGGANVRGGYTRPRLFEVTSDDETDIFDNVKAVIACDNDDCRSGQTQWHTDDGCCWYYDDSTPYVQLEKVESIKASDELFAEAELRSARMFDEEERQGKLFKTSSDTASLIVARAGEHVTANSEGSDEWKVWKLVVAIASGDRLLRYTEEGIGYCPNCKRGVLKSYF